MELKTRLVLGLCVVLSLVVSPLLGYTGCNPTPIKIGPEICIGCQTQNVTATWPPGYSASGWLPIKFKYNERQHGVAVQAVDKSGQTKTWKLSTLDLEIEDVGRYDGAWLKGPEVNEFFHWPIVVLYSMIPGSDFNATCWYMGSIY